MDGDFMLEQQQKLIVSPYIEIYKLVVPKDNLLRQINEMVRGKRIISKSIY